MTAQRKERGGYAAGDTTVAELRPPPPSVTAAAQPEEDSSLAAMISAVADGYPADGDEKAVLELALITRLLEGKKTWAQIGAVQGISGREAKRRAHKLRLRVQRSVMAATGMS